MPRNKRTKPLAAKEKAALVEIADGLPELTEQQLAFVYALMEGKSASDAYRGAYDAREMAPATIWARASELKRNGKVAAWLREATIIGMNRAGVTEEGHLSELASLREEGRATGNIGAAVLAETNRGKVAGLYTERLEVSGAALNGAELLSSLAKLLSPDVVAAVARDLGLPWPTH